MFFVLDFKFFFTCCKADGYQNIVKFQNKITRIVVLALKL